MTKISKLIVNNCKQTINDGLVDQRIARDVLEGLEGLASGLGLNGDLKD